MDNDHRGAVYTRQRGARHDYAWETFTARQYRRFMKKSKRHGNPGTPSRPAPPHSANHYAGALTRQWPTLGTLSTQPQDTAAYRMLPGRLGIEAHGDMLWASPPPLQAQTTRPPVQDVVTWADVLRWDDNHQPARPLAPATLDRIRAGMARIAQSGCECTSAPLPGVFYDSVTGDVQRCDACQVFRGDLEAAAALGAQYGTTVRFFAEGDNIDDTAQARTYDPAEGFDGMIADSTNPWIKPRVVPTPNGWAVDRG
jgi:hypothetical protein